MLEIMRMLNLSLRLERTEFVPLPRDKTGPKISINSRKICTRNLKKKDIISTHLSPVEVMWYSPINCYLVPTSECEAYTIMDQILIITDANILFMFCIIYLCYSLIGLILISLPKIHHHYQFVEALKGKKTVNMK